MPLSIEAQGNPNSPTCRHCDAKRIRFQGAWMCERCDRTDLIAGNHQTD